MAQTGCHKTAETVCKVVLSRASRAHRAALISISCSPQLDTSRSCKTMDTGLVHRVVCPFTPQLSLELINRPRRDGTLSWRWYTAGMGRSGTHDLAIAKSGTVPLGHRAPKLFNKYLLMVTYEYGENYSIQFKMKKTLFTHH